MIRSISPASPSLPNEKPLALGPTMDFSDRADDNLFMWGNMAVNADIKINDTTLEVNLSGEFEGKIPEEARFGRLAQTCLDQQLNKLLINVSKLSGHLGTMARLQLGMEFVQAFRDTEIKIAVIGNAALLEAKRFFENAAQGRHKLIRVFKDVKGAETWLHDNQDAPVTGG